MRGEGQEAQAAAAGIFAGSSWKLPAQSSSQHSRELLGRASSLRDVSNWVCPVYRLLAHRRIFTSHQEICHRNGAPLTLTEVLREVLDKIAF